MIKVIIIIIIIIIIVIIIVSILQRDCLDLETNYF